MDKIFLPVFLALLVGAIAARAADMIGDGVFLVAVLFVAAGITLTIILGKRAESRAQKASDIAVDADDHTASTSGGMFGNVGHTRGRPLDGDLSVPSPRGFADLPPHPDDPKFPADGTPLRSDHKG